MCQTSAIPTSEAGSESAAATTPAARRQELEDVAFGPPEELWAMAVEIAALRGCKPGALPPGRLYWECSLDELHALRVDTKARTCSVWQLSGYRRWAQSAAEPPCVWVMRAWLEAHDASAYRGRLSQTEPAELDEVRHVLQTALESARLERKLVRVSFLSAEVSP